MREFSELIAALFEAKAEAELLEAATAAAAATLAWAAKAACSWGSVVHDFLLSRASKVGLFWRLPLLEPLELQSKINAIYIWA